MNAMYRVIEAVLELVDAIQSGMNATKPVGKRPNGSVGIVASGSMPTPPRVNAVHALAS